MKFKDILEFYGKPIILSLILIFIILSIEDVYIFYDKYYVADKQTISPKWILLAISIIVGVKNISFYQRFKDAKAYKEKIVYGYVFNLEYNDKNCNEIRFISYVILFLNLILNICVIGFTVITIAKTHDDMWVWIIIFILSISVFFIFKLLHPFILDLCKIKLIAKIVNKLPFRQYLNKKAKKIKVIFLSLFLFMLYFLAIGYYSVKIKTGIDKYFALKIQNDTLSLKNNQLTFNNRNFNGIDLKNSMLQYINLKKCSFNNATLDNTDFSNSTFDTLIDFTNASIGNINIVNCNLRQIKGLKLSDLIKIPTENRVKVNYPQYILDSIKILNVEKKDTIYCILLENPTDKKYCGCNK